MASGQFVHILDADDRYAHSGVLSSVIAAMTAHDWDVCHGRAAHVTRSGRIVRVNGRPLDKRHLLKKMWAAQPSVVVRRSIYERFGGFSVGFRIAGDYEFLLRIWDHVRVGFLDEILVHMTIGGISTRPENVVHFLSRIDGCRRDSWRASSASDHSVLVQNRQAPDIFRPSVPPALALDRSRQLAASRNAVGRP